MNLGIFTAFESFQEISLVIVAVVNIEIKKLFQFLGDFKNILIEFSFQKEGEKTLIDHLNFERQKRNQKKSKKKKFEIYSHKK